MGTFPPERGEETQGVTTYQVTTTRIRIKSTKHAQFGIKHAPSKHNSTRYVPELLKVAVFGH
jgi:hypothetical protein